MFRLCSKEKSSEIEDIMKTSTFAENGGEMMRQVGMYSGTVRPWANFLFMMTNLSFLSYTAYISIAVNFDFALFSSCCHYMLMILSCGWSIVNSQVKQRQILSMLRELDKGFYIYTDTVDPETRQLMDSEKAIMKKRKNRRFWALVVLFICTFIVSLAIFPIIFSVKNDDLDDNIHREMPVVVWYPISTKDWLGFLWLLFTEYWIACVVAATGCSTDAVYLCFAEEGLYQLKALGYTLRHVFRRARYTYRKCYKKDVVSYKDPKFHKCLKLCVKESIQHHHAILKYYKALANIYFTTLLVIMLGSTFLLCISGLLFITPNIETKPKLQNGCYLITLLVHTLTFYWYGEEISNNSLDLSEDLYESGWEACSHVMKRYILIMMDYTKLPIVMTAGGFTVMNLSTYGNLLSSAYSYFNLMTIMMTRE